MNNYETVFIMNPVLSDEQVRETVKKFIDYLKSKKATISHEENWGLKKLKYVIQKKKTGFYYLIEFQADGSIIGNFEKLCFEKHHHFHFSKKSKKSCFLRFCLGKT